MNPNNQKEPFESETEKGTQEKQKLKFKRHTVSSNIKVTHRNIDNIDAEALVKLLIYTRLKGKGLIE